MNIANTTLLNTKDLSKKLGMSYQGILKWVRDGKIPHVRLGSHTIRYDEEVIDKWLADKSNAAQLQGKGS